MGNCLLIRRPVDPASPPPSRDRVTEVALEACSLKGRSSLNCSYLDLLTASLKEACSPSLSSYYLGHQTMISWKGSLNLLNSSCLGSFGVPEATLGDFLLERSSVRWLAALRDCISQRGPVTQTSTTRT
jgi:hypothetical protein